MKQGSTLVLRSAITAIGLVVLAICVFALPRAISAELTSDFDYLPIMIGLYAPAVPFFIALYQSLKLLNNIDNNNAFSESSVAAFKNIKYCAVIISTLFLAGMPYIFHVADQDDAPGLVAIGFVIVFASFVIATFAAVLQKLVQHAVDIKNENDLTV